MRLQILAGMEANRTPAQIAASLIGTKNLATGRREGGVIGLTARQADMVIAAEAKLRSGDPALMAQYLALKTRDKRFDRTVTKAIREGRPVTAADTAKIIRQLRDRNLKYRADVIAENETITAMRAGRHEGYRQMLETGAVTEDQIERSWSDTGDGRTRLSHRALDGQKVRGLTMPFVSPMTGARMMYPGDTSLGAPAQEVIRCRCWEKVRIIYVKREDRPESPVVDTAKEDAIMKAYVLDNGRREKREFLWSYDEVTGERLGQNSGAASTVGFTPEFAAAIADRSRNIIAHHNHPRSSSFSKQDIIELSRQPGLKGLWAHGHDGSSYFARKGSTTNGAEANRELTQVGDAVTYQLRRAIEADPTIYEDVAKSANHVIALAWERRGLIKGYTYKLSKERQFGAKMQALIEEILRSI